METQRLDFPIDGMSCTACAVRIENEPQSFPGVQAAQVDFATERAILRPGRGRLILGDIIVGVEADPVTSMDDSSNALDKYKVGDTVTVAIIRDDARLTVPLTLQALQ